MKKNITAAERALRHVMRGYQNDRRQALPWFVWKSRAVAVLILLLNRLLLQNLKLNCRTNKLDFRGIIMTSIKYIELKTGYTQIIRDIKKILNQSISKEVLFPYSFFNAPKAILFNYSHI